jgi:ABC-type polysaccharide/polyol phosphate transport system ATPase subunit
MKTPVIECCDVSKKFLLQRSGSRTLKAAMIGLFRRTPLREFWALRDVSFAVGEGETLGIIGANGAGKSTLLSILAGTLTPTSGTLRAQGRVSSLLELGAGFHPELTGRENVFLWGSIMGLSKGKMRDRFDRIVDFAELRDYIDQPVKHYSSGMYVRLGFAVAVEVDPDILLVDEVLSVGDLAFQKKCLQRMDEFRKRGKTMLIVSHDMQTIQAISNRILFLNAGRVMGHGAPESMVGQYESHLQAAHAGTMSREWGTREALITQVTFTGADGQSKRDFKWDEPVHVSIGYKAPHRIVQPVFGFSIADQAGHPIYGNNTQNEAVSIPFIEGEGTIRLRFPRLPFPSGTFLFSASLHSADHKTHFHHVDNGFPIQIVAPFWFVGCYLPIQWEIPS